MLSTMRRQKGAFVLEQVFLFFFSFNFAGQHKWQTRKKLNMAFGLTHKPPALFIQFSRKIKKTKKALFLPKSDAWQAL